MRNFLKLFSLACMLMIGNHAVAVSQCAETGVWDWYADDFKDFDGRYMDKPWVSDAHIGVSMETNPMCFEDGWRMMSRRFKCTDFYTFDECKTAVSRPGSYKPKFALYNIHTGLARFFLYVDSGVTQTQRVQLSFSMDQGSSGHDYGLFLNDNDEVTVYDDKTKATNTGKMMMFPSYGLSEQAPKWLIFDKYLSFEPNNDPDDGLQFNIYIDGIEETAINLDGNFEFKIEEVQSVKEKSVIETLIDSKDDVMKAYASVSEFSSDLSDKGQAMIDKELEDSGYDPDIGPPNLNSRRYSLGLNMLSLATSIGNSAGPLGYVAAASTLIGAFDNSPSAPRIFYGTGTISLEGTNFSQYGINHRAFGVPYSTHTERSNEARLEEDGHLDALGLFHFTGRPQMAFYEKNTPASWGTNVRTLSGRLLEDIRPLVTINPNTGMILEEIKIMPHLELKDFGLGGDYPVNTTYGGYGIREEEGYLYAPVLDFENDSEIIAEMQEKYFATSSNKGKGYLVNYSPDNYSKLIGTTFLDAKDAMYLSIRASGQHGFLSNPIKYFIEDAKLRVYLKFSHPEKPNVFAEFVKILDVDEYTCNSGAADVLLSSLGTKSMDVCRGNVDTDNDGVLDYIEVGFSFNPFDGADMDEDADLDGLSNIEEINEGGNPHEYSIEPQGCSLGSYKAGYPYFVLSVQGSIGSFVLPGTFSGQKLSGDAPSVIVEGETMEVSRFNSELMTKLTCQNGKLYSDDVNGVNAIPYCIISNINTKIKDITPLSAGKCGDY